MEAKVPSVTRVLLLCGAASGPLFILAALVQAFTVPGFDVRADLISLLSLGPFGFVQIANFALCGVLNVLCAVGLWRTLHGGPGGTLAPVLIGLHGLLLVVVAVFVTDPVNGFPPGSAAPATPSSHGIIHAGGALWVFVTCAAALAVLTRYFLSRRELWWAAYCAASAAFMLVMFFGSFTFQANAALLLDISLAIGWMGVSAVAAKLLAGPTVRSRRPETRQWTME